MSVSMLFDPKKCHTSKTHTYFSEYSHHSITATKTQKILIIRYTAYNTTNYLKYTISITTNYINYTISTISTKYNT